MAQTMRRKEFLVLTVTLTTLGMSACEDDEAGEGDGPAGGSGDGGDDGNAGKGGQTGGTGNGGTNAGTSSAGSGTSGSGGKPSGGDGSAGDGGKVGGAPSAGAGGGGAAGDPAGGAGGGAAGEPAMPEGGAGGAGGASTEPLECQDATLTQTLGTHEHIPANPGSLFATFAVLVNGSNPTAPFALPQNGTGHSHNITLTLDEVATLRAGGTVTGKVSSVTGSHSHTYTISCG